MFKDGPHIKQVRLKKNAVEMFIIYNTSINIGKKERKKKEGRGKNEI